MVALPAAHPLSADAAVELAEVDPESWIATPVDALGLMVEGGVAR